MPKVINQNGVSIDSLHAKLTFLETKFSKLSNEHKLLQDSLKNLDKTLQKADIKTDFFTDQLGFQLFWFSVILAVLSWLSWKTFLDPIQKEVDNLGKKTIPDLRNETKDFMETELKRIDELSKDLSKTVENTVNSNYRAFAVQSSEAKKYHYLVLYGIKTVYHAVYKLNIDPGNSILKNQIEMILEGTLKKPFRINLLEKHKKSIMKELNYLICSENEDMSNIATKIKIKLNELFDNTMMPTSAIEVDPQAGESAQ